MNDVRYFEQQHKNVKYIHNIYIYIRITRKKRLFFVGVALGMSTEWGSRACISEMHALYLSLNSVYFTIPCILCVLQQGGTCRLSSSSPPC